LAAAGTAAPEDRPLDGTNLLPVLLQGESIKPRKLFWAHSQARAMRDGVWKLVDERPGSKPPALYNLQEDLGEQQDLAERHPERVQAMLAAVDAWQRDVTTDATPQPDTPPIEQ
jgi:arylsulfatase A-like enzyme